MTKKKIFKVEFDVEPINKSDSTCKTVGIIWWDILINPTAYIAASNIVDALAKVVVNLDEFAKTVPVKEGYRICGVKGISEYYQEVYV